MSNNDTYDLNIKLGLENVNEALKLLGSPHLNYLAIHVGGTNGKGSVCRFLELGLIEAAKYTKASLKIAKFISPHIYSITERFSINEKPISKSLFDTYYSALFSDSFVGKTKADIDSLIILDHFNKSEQETISENKYSLVDYKLNDHLIESLTEFEKLTVLAFKLFFDLGVDVAIVEVGLGGRLDATNVLNSQTILHTVITNVSLDHMEYLGNTVEEIRIEKEGIIKDSVKHIDGELYEKTLKKQNTPISVNHNSISGINLHLSLKILSTICKDSRFQDIVIFKREMANVDMLFQDLGYSGDFISKQILEPDNSIEVNFQDLAKHLLSVRHEYVGNFSNTYRFRQHFDAAKKVIVDAAHNIESAKSLNLFIKEVLSKDSFLNNEPKVFILGFLDKDIESFLYNLLSGIFNPSKDKIIFFEIDSIRATKLSQYHLLIKKILHSQMIIGLKKDNFICTNDFKYIRKDYIDNELIYSSLKIISGSIYMLKNIN